MIADYFKIDYESRIADETERLDNTANTEILNSLGWYAKTNLYNYDQFSSAQFRPKRMRL